MTGLTAEQCLEEAERAEAIAKIVAGWVPSPSRQGGRDLGAGHFAAIDFWMLTAEALRQRAKALTQSEIFNYRR